VCKWEILGIIDEGVNNEAWSLLEWIAWHSFPFHKASCVSGYSFHDPCTFYATSYFAPLWCELYNSSAHNVSSCPYYACYAHSDSSLPLTKSMGLEVGELFGLVARIGMNNACCGLEISFDEVHNLVDTPLEGCSDMFMHEKSPSLGSNHVVPNPLEHSHVSTFCSQPSLSLEFHFEVPIDNFVICDFNVDLGNANNMLNVLGGNIVDHFESLGNFSGYDAALDPYCMNLVDTPRKIMWTPFFTFSFDFSMAFALLTRALIFLIMFIVKLSQHHTSEPHTVEFDKFLRALTASNLRAWVVKCDGVADAPCAPFVGGHIA